MAINWKPGEALRVLREGKDQEAIADICKRFPMFAINAMTEEGLVKLVEAIPANISARQLNKSLTEGLEVEEEEEQEQKSVKKEKEQKSKGKGKSKKQSAPEPEEEDEFDEEEYEEEEQEAPDFAKMDNAELKEACKELGLKIEKGMKKSDVVKMLKKHVAGEDEQKSSKGKGKAKSKKHEEEDDDDWDI